MTTIQQQHPLPYFADSSLLFETIVDKSWSVFLDSGFPYNDKGRFDIIASDPEITLVTTEKITTICNKGEISCSDKDPFLLLKQYLKTSNEPVSELPFNGGAIGYFSYDLARRLENLPVLTIDQEHIAEMVIGIYSWAVVVDHKKQQSWLLANAADDCKRLVKQFSSLPKNRQIEKFSILEKPRSNMDLPRYQQAFNKIKAYLTEGDSYQVNLAQRFSCRCSGNPWPAYKLLREINSAPFSAYLNLPNVQVLSSSPERFLKVLDRDVETKPIKGTLPRLENPQQDALQKLALSNSKKDKAENVMIVDLLRNDMSKNCKKGSVKVPALFEIESFATVHHLVSTVTGILNEGQHALDLLRSCFPGGSITGAPKIRSMEIIEELEPNRRGVYCGSIGYIGFNGNMDTNIAIRTFVHSDNTIRFWAGGGIVNDSVMADEYQESFDKASALLQVLNTFSAYEEQ